MNKSPARYGEVKRALAGKGRFCRFVSFRLFVSFRVVSFHSFRYRRYYLFGSGQWARAAPRGGVVKTRGLTCHDEVAKSIGGRGRNCRSAHEPSLTIRSVVGTRPVTNG